MALIVHSAAAMEPSIPPANYRLEHRQEGLTPFILNLFITETAAHVTMGFVTRRLERQGMIGEVILVNQETNPEQELARHVLRPSGRT